MFTGGHCHSRAIPSAPPPPAEATKLTPLRSTPPPELSASTAELTINSTITTANPRGFFPGGRGTKKKKTEKSLHPKSYLLSYSCKDRQQQQPTKTHYHETLLRFIRQLHRPQPDGTHKWLC